MGLNLFGLHHHHFQIRQVNLQAVYLVSNQLDDYQLELKFQQQSQECKGHHYHQLHRHYRLSDIVAHLTDYTDDYQQLNNHHQHRHLHL